METQETLLVRLRPLDPRRGATLRSYTYRGVRFHIDRGWHRVPKDIAEYLRSVRTFDTERAEDGWYYLKLDVPRLPEGRRLFVEFEGVAMVSRAYCNGQLLGEHKGMFSRFEYDLTPHLRATETSRRVLESTSRSRIEPLHVIDSDHERLSLAK